MNNCYSENYRIQKARKHSDTTGILPRRCTLLNSNPCVAFPTELQGMNTPEAEGNQGSEDPLTADPESPAQCPKTQPDAQSPTMPTA
jgi:hypothetical protein